MLATVARHVMLANFDMSSMCRRSNFTWSIGGEITGDDEEYE